MAIRPWNVFKKTLYDAQAQRGHLPVTARISLARAGRSQHGAEGDASAPSTSAEPVARLFAALLVPSTVVWFSLLAARWRYSDVDRLRELEARPGGGMLLDFLGWRVTAHLGPYQVPNMVHARLHEAPLRALRDPLLLDHERTRALWRLELLTQRRLAANSLAPEDEETAKVGGAAALRAVEPLLRYLFGDQDTVSGCAASHRAATAHVVFDVVCATTPAERLVPQWALSGLATARGVPWDSGPQGEEMRATLLMLLLASPANCIAAASLAEVQSYIERPGFKQKEDTMWPLKSYLLSGETPDLLRRCARLVNQQCPDSLEVPVRRARDTPSLQMKHDLRNLWTTALLTTCWAGFRAWRGVANPGEILRIVQSCAGALMAMAVLEGVWHSEERIIQSRWYFDDSHMVLAFSACVCVLNCGVWAWAFRYTTAVPYILCRLVKDDFTDAYRSYEYHF